ncbi:Similar to CCT7: T-complex protein 1 subunit eta (Gallus gallus) [Cotesia congregata]|uniref:T-complex protein 1 subunit eta n=1 Tax=Cotesia congregata TaxID=51543 RepID=A0A8J2EI01_COTCN|nr:Similar to CCT7: T-complex protein 1 subunit eta (Gallus gallus) [Cotesia congregata]
MVFPVQYGAISRKENQLRHTQPQIILLKEGTDVSQGKAQLVSNINACQQVVDAVRTTLGPRGMDKLIVDANGKGTISNDGATILKLLDIVHPAAKTLVDIAKSQDEGVHPRIIIKAFRNARKIAIERIQELSVKIEKSTAEEKRSLLEKCAATAMNSKLIHQQKDFFSKMVVDAVLLLDELLPLNMIGIKKVSGGALEDSILVAGVAFKKTFSYAGFEMQPKKYSPCKIAMLNIELELKAERDNAEVRVDNVAEYQKIVDAEWQILYEKLEKIAKSGANVVLSKLPIGDVATQYFADRDMFCAGRVPDEDLKRTMKACGGAVITTVNDIDDTETERSLHDAIMIVRRMIKNDAVVAGGGAIEIELSRTLRDYSRTIAGKEQLLIGAIARALEVIPRQLCDNAGFDATNILNKLRQKHHQGKCWFGVDILNEDIADNMDACVWEPAVVKINALTAASEAACLILSVDETIKNPRSGDAPQMPVGGMGRGMGRPIINNNNNK